MSHTALSIAASFPGSGYRQAAARVSKAGYVTPMAAMTVCYLVFELGFNARLLDVTGGLATSQDIAGVERWGRLLSGIAVTLAVWGMAVMPWCHKKELIRLGYGVVCGTVGALCVGSCFVGERSLIDRMVDTSSGEARRAALQLRVMSSAIRQGTEVLDGMDTSADRLLRPEGKAFLSLFPFLALSAEHLGEKLRADIDGILKISGEKDLGTKEDTYNRIFIASIKILQAQYNAYVDGANRYADAMGRIPQERERLWRTYEDDLRRQGRTPDTVPKSYWGQVATRLRTQGLDIPATWNPSDHAAFDRAVASRISNDALHAFETRTRSLLGAALPPGLSWKDFCSQSAIQTAWRARIGASRTVRLSPDMTFAAYADNVYPSLLDHYVQVNRDMLFHPARDYADGGMLEHQGRSAMKSLIVPPFALFLSLTGALIHIFKSAHYLMRALAPGFGKKMNLTLLCVVSGAALSVFAARNSVTAAPMYLYFEQRTGDNIGHIAALGARWVIQAQPCFYPINETIRERVLFGMRYAGSG